MSNGKYTEAEIAEFARRQGCSLDLFKMRWIIQSKGSYWVHGPKGYLPPVGMSDLPNVVRDYLVRAKNVKHGVRLSYTKENRDTGESIEVDFTPEVILKNHATVAFHISSSLSAPYSYFDPIEATLVERICPLRPITPAYDANIDKWLRLLGGEKADKLLDWTATATQLERQTCGIFFHGPKDTGKTVYAQGMSQLWSTGGPTDMKEYAAQFNDALAKCPLLFADEALPPNVNSGTLRVMIGSSSHTLHRKNVNASKITGCFRVLIAANTPDIIKFDEEFQREDVDAIASRILYIKVDPEAARFLKSLGGATGELKDWVSGGKIAAHALWLAENRKVTPGTRFIVEGEKEAWHNRLATSNRDQNIIIEWIIRALQHHWSAALGDEYPHFRFGHGKVFVNSAFISSKWKDLFPDDFKPPTTAKVGRSITPILTGKSEKLNVVRDPKKKRHRLNLVEVEVSHILRIADEFQMALPEDLARLIGRKKWNWEPADGVEEVFEEEARSHLSSVPQTAPAQAETGAFADLAAGRDIGVFSQVPVLLCKHDGAPPSDRPAQSLLDRIAAADTHK